MADKVEEANAVSTVVESNVASDTLSDNEDIFVTENDTFTVTIRYYKVGSKIKVEKVADDFDDKHTEIKSFTMTFKYPSHGDYEGIMNSSTYKSPDQMKVSDVIQMELSRMVTLFRSWSLNQDITRMIEMDPDILKAACSLIRDEIGLKGIL